MDHEPRAALCLRTPRGSVLWDIRSATGNWAHRRPHLQSAAHTSRARRCRRPIDGSRQPHASRAEVGRSHRAARRYPQDHRLEAIEGSGAVRSRLPAPHQPEGGGIEALEAPSTPAMQYLQQNAWPIFWWSVAALLFVVWPASVWIRRSMIYRRLRAALDG